VTNNAVGSTTEGLDAVINCIGIRPTRKPVSVFSEGITNVLESMDKNRVNLLISVTGIGAGDSRGHGGFFYDKIFQPLLLNTIYEDKDREESLIKDSQVNWIIVRPGFLTNGPMTGTYRVLTDMQNFAGRCRPFHFKPIGFFRISQSDTNVDLLIT